MSFVDSILRISIYTTQRLVVAGLNISLFILAAAKLSPSEFGQLAISQSIAFVVGTFTSGVISTSAIASLKTAGNKSKIIGEAQYRRISLSLLVAPLVAFAVTYAMGSVELGLASAALYFVDAFNFDWVCVLYARNRIWSLKNIAINCFNLVFCFIALLFIPSYYVIVFAYAISAAIGVVIYKQIGFYRVTKCSLIYVNVGMSHGIKSLLVNGAQVLAYNGPIVIYGANNLGGIIDSYALMYRLFNAITFLVGPTIDFYLYKRAIWTSRQMSWIRDSAKIISISALLPLAFVVIPNGTAVHAASLFINLQSYQDAYMIIVGSKIIALGYVFELYSFKLSQIHARIRISVFFILAAISALLISLFVGSNVFIYTAIPLVTYQVLVTLSVCCCQKRYA